MEREIFPPNPSPESQEWIIIPHARQRMPFQRPRESFEWSELVDPVVFEIQNMEEFKMTVDQLRETLLRKSYRAIALWFMFWFVYCLCYFLIPIDTSTPTAFLVVNTLLFIANVPFLCYSPLMTKKHNKELARFLTEWSQKLPEGYMWMYQVRHIGRGKARRRFSRLVFQVPLKQGASTNVETPLEMSFDMENDTNRERGNRSTARGRTEIEMTRSIDHFCAGEDPLLNDSDEDMQFFAAHRGEQI